MGRREELRSMQEAWRAYLDLALGFTEASRKRATKVARKLVGRGGATAEQLQSMAEDLVSTSMANRESLIRLVRFELDRALGRVGLATAEEVAQLTKRVRELEEELRVAQAGGSPTVLATSDDELAASAVAAAPAPAKVVRKAVAKKAVAGAPATATAPAKAAAAKAAPVKAEPAAKAAPAKAAPVKVTASAKAAPATVAVEQAEPAKATPATVAAKTVAKKAVAKAPAKAVAKKTAPSKATGTGPGGAQP